MWWRVYLRFNLKKNPKKTKNQNTNIIWQIKFLNAAELRVINSNEVLGSFSSPLQEKPWPLGSSRNLPHVPSCPWASTWVHRVLCRRRRWSEMLWGNGVAEELTFLQSQWYLLPTFSKLQTTKTVYFAFGIKPPCSLCTLETCRNLIFEKLPLLFSQPSHFSIKRPINIHHIASPSKTSFSLPTLSPLGRHEVNQLFSGWSWRLPGCSGRWIAPLPFMTNAE